jgi:hypothetical protein
LVLFFRKEQDSSFSEEKEAKRLLFVEHGVPKSGTWPENGLLINSLAQAGWGEQLPLAFSALQRRKKVLIF